MVGTLVFLLTQLTVPVALLWLGHGYRNRSPRQKRFFWGGTLGYLASIAVVTLLLLLPPVFWGANGGLRWLAIQWTPGIMPATAAVLLGLAVESDQS
jgi:hypothetical protein